MTLSPEKVCAVVLAAGLSKRFGPSNKLLAGRDGKLIITAVVGALIEAGLKDILVVTGFEQANVRQALAGLPVRFANNPDFATGMASSIKCGIQVIPETSDAALIMLGDMPSVGSTTVTALIENLAANPAKSVAVPVYRGKRGNPVLWRRNRFNELAALDGDMGGRKVMSDNPKAVLEVAVDDPGIHFDIDTKAILDGAPKGP